MIARIFNGVLITSSSKKRFRVVKNQTAAVREEQGSLSTDPNSIGNKTIIIILDSSIDSINKDKIMGLTVVL